MRKWSGGCLCGTVRYELSSDPFDAGWCHCRTCQLFGGAPAMAFASAPTEDFRWTAGEDQVRRFRSSGFGHREFCGQCGSPLRIQVDHQAGNGRFPDRDAGPAGRCPARVSHLLGKQGRLV
jgi:hypothetical protein